MSRRVTRTYTNMAEKGLILVRVIMTVIYGHVIHSLRRAGIERAIASRESSTMQLQGGDESSAITERRVVGE